MQNRIWWAVQAVGIKPDGNTGGYTPVKGVQSVGTSVDFNTERYRELGQSNTYQSIEDAPDVTFTINRFLDGNIPLYCLATQGAPTPSLMGRQSQKSILAWSVVSDISDSVSGTPLAVVESSGNVVGSIGYNFTVTEPFTEDITLLSNHAWWSPGGTSLFGTPFTGTIFDNNDTPLNIETSGGLQTRERFIFDGQANVTLLPTKINGISSSGTNPDRGDGYLKVAVQSVNITADFGREDLLELGRKTAYYKAASFPIAVGCTIEVNSFSGSFVSVTEQGVYSGGRNTLDERIKIVLKDGTVFDLGDKNSLQNVTYGNGDTGGGNATDTYTYENDNFLTVTHPLES